MAEHQAQLLGRRAVLLTLGQLGVTIAVAACSSSNASPGPSPAPSTTGAPPSTPVRGAAPLPAPPPTPGGPPPTVVGAGTASPAPQANASGPFSVESAASPVSSPAAAASPSAVVRIPASPEAAGSVTITPDRRFDPAALAIQAGQTVVWRNTSRNPHTVTCDPARVSDPSHVVLPAGAQPFDSGVINPNGTFTHTFDIAGDYQYVSLPFEELNMFGRVTVRGQESA